jgi:cytochrome P450
MGTRPPVNDWATDFDHLDRRWVNDPFPIWDELRQKCPIAHTGRYLGVYLPTRYEDVRAVAYDTEHFSSRRVIVREVRPEQLIPSPPITSDPPHHKFAKQLLLPPFTPDEMVRLKPRAQAICNELIDKFIAAGSCDAAQEYTRHVPVRVIAHMLACPRTTATSIKWIHEILSSASPTEATLMKAIPGDDTVFRRPHRGAQGEADAGFDPRP